MYFIDKAWRYTILFGEEWKIRDQFAFKSEHHNRGSNYDCTFMDWNSEYIGYIKKK